MKYIALFVLCISTGIGATQAQNPTIFSGTLIYSVEPMDVPDSRRAQIPTQVELSTNGTDFMVVERGVDFERVWVQQAGEARVHFYFLGHAISLEVACDHPSVRDLVIDETLGKGPCFWPGSSMPTSWVHSEDGIAFRVKLQQISQVSSWPKEKFRHPDDHVLMDRLTLSTLLSGADLPRQ